MDKSFQFLFGTTPGQHHIEIRTGNEDALAFGETIYQGNHFRFGFVSDGSSGGKKNILGGTNSFVGSTKAVTFLYRRTKDLIEQGKDIYIIPNLLFTDLIAYLQKSVDAEGETTPENIRDLIDTYYLFTVLGFIQGPQETVLFYRGDGVYRINQQIISINENNQAHYPAYLLVPWSVPDAFLHWGFSYVTVPTEKVNVLAIATDGWKEQLELLKTIESYNDEPRTLHRQLGIWSADDYYFEDDATIVLLYKI